MNTEAMRQALLAMFPNSRSWKARVIKMTDAQVFAIYKRQINKKRLGRLMSDNKKYAIITSSGVAIILGVIAIVAFFMGATKADPTGHIRPTHQIVAVHHKVQSHIAGDAKTFAIKYGCKHFKYGGAYFAGTCVMNGHQVSVTTFDSHADRILVERATKQYHYLYLVNTDQGAITRYIPPTS